VLAAPLTVNLAAGPTISYRNARGANITAAWGTINTASNVITSIPAMTVNGQAQVMRDPDFIAARGIMKSSSVNLVNQVLTVNVPSRSLSVDWTGSTPVITR
jgi:hypothetical protein